MQQAILMAVLMVMVYAVSLDLRPDDFRYVARHPLAVADRRAVVIEAGMQNSGLALGIIAAQFGSDLAMVAVAVAVAGLWGVWHIVSGGGLALFWRKT